MFLIGVFGVLTFCFLAFLFSKNKKAIDWKLVIWGIVMQFIIAAIILGKGLISIIPFFLWVWAIVWYNLYRLIFINKQFKNILEALFSLLFTSLCIFVVYLMGGKVASIVSSVFWYLFVFLGIFKLLLTSFEKKVNYPKNWANIFGVLIPCFILADIIVNNKTGSDFFNDIGNAVTYFISFSSLGGNFVFGPLADKSLGSIFIINIGVSAIFIVALIGLIDSFGLTNAVILSIARFIDWNMKGFRITPLSGAETLVAISSIPMGGDNLLLIKNYLPSLTRSEIVLSMSSIMATITSSLFVAFVSMGISAVHIISASVMSVPAAIVVSKIAFPEIDKPTTRGSDIDLIKDENYGKPMSGLMTGTLNAIQTVLIIAGCLIVFISLIGVIDSVLAKGDLFIDGELLKGSKNSYGEYKGIFPGSLKTLLGYIFAPFAFLMGTPLQDVIKMGYLMGTKVSINEFVAFTQLHTFIANNELTEKSIVIASFALCGFANPGTVAIMLGKVLPFAGDNKENYINLAFKTMFIGAAASWMTATIAGIIFGLL